MPPAVINVVNDQHPIDLTDLPEVRQLFDYLEARAQSEELRVTFFKPRTLGWETGVAAMGPPRGQPHCIVGELRQREITHAIMGSVYGGANSYMRAVIQQYPAFFEQEFQNRSFTVYAFRPGPEVMTFAQYPECQRR
jgi:hypothetical protein